MNVDCSNDMAAQAWQSQSVQHPAPGQSSVPQPSGLPHGTTSSSTSGTAQAIPVYTPLHATTYSGPRWQPPAHTGLPTVQTVLPPGPTGHPVPSAPWISIRPLPAGSPGASASPASHDSPIGSSVPPTAKPAESPVTVDSGPALATHSVVQVSSTVSQASGSLSSSSSIPASINSTEEHPTITGSGASGLSDSSIPEPSLPSAPPGVSTSSASGSAILQGSSAGNSSAMVGSAPPPTSFSHSGPFVQRSTGDSPAQSLMPTVSASITPPSSVGVTPLNAIPQAPMYTPYINVPAVPNPVSHWTFQPQTGVQVQARPMPAFVPTPYLPPVRPVVPLQTGVSMGHTADATALLAPPGEQCASSKITLSGEGGKFVTPSSPLAGQISTYGVSNITSERVTIESASRLDEETVDDGADAWSAHKTPGGVVYYYNSVTGQSTYDKPAGFRGEVDKVTAQPTPVSCDLIGGTGWAVVTTNDNKKYYYHTVTRATSWQVPHEVVEYRKRLAEESLAKSGAIQAAKVVSEKGTVFFSSNAPVGGPPIVRDGPKLNTQAASSSALDLIKKKLQDSTTPAIDNVDGNSNRHLEGEGAKEKGKDNNTEKSSSESSSDSDDEDQGPTKEEQVAQFKEMLKEKGIVPFSKWEKELPKIIFDPRFKAIPSHTERRAIFDHYVRTRAEEERKEKRAAQKAAIEGFKQLLDEASKDLSHNTDYEKFAKFWSADPRFQTLERKDRENLLNERLLPLRKAEEERIRAIHAAAAAGFKAMLKEIGDVTSSTRWSKVKDKLRNDPRYRAVKREERESLFNSYVNELMSAEQEHERAAKAKREEEEKLKEREREMRKRKEREEQEMERVRVKARKRDATISYQALLTEKIKDPEASWTESRPKLEKDPLGRATNPELDNAERERLFRKHVASLYDRCVHDYMALLADVITVDAASKPNEEGKTALTSWSEAKKLLKADPRYVKMPRREKESLWRRHADDIQRKNKAASNSSKDEKHSVLDSSKSAVLDGNRRTSSHK